MGFIRARVQNFLFRHLFNGVVPSDVLREVGGTLTYAGRKLSDEETRGIISEAEALSGSGLLAMVIAEMRNAAYDSIFNRSSSVGDLVAPKSVLWTLDLIEKKVRALASRRPPAPPKRS